MKYGIRVPRNAKESTHFDRYNGNSLWDNAILKKLEALMLISVFKKLLPSLCKARGKGYQFAPLWVIFDVKIDFRRKSRLFI